MSPTPPTSSPPRPLGPAALRAPAPPRLYPRAAPLLVAAPVLVLALVAWVLLAAWSRRVPELAPHHRAEALCFELERPPRFDPPMVVEPSAALVQRRFEPGTDASLALRQLMQFDESMVVEEHVTRFGDFDVTTLWLCLPPGEPARHWLVVAWMEGEDLAVCTFRFAGTDRELTPEEREWGGQLLARILRPEYFRASALPSVTLRARPDATLPAFGPD
jgi:hypothetical protein